MSGDFCTFLAVSPPLSLRPFRVTKASIGSVDVKVVGSSASLLLFFGVLLRN